MTILLLQDTVSKTAAFAGSAVDVSALPATGWTIKLQVSSFDAAQTARISIEDSADNFSSDILAGPTEAIQGGLSASADLVLHWAWYDFPDLRVGSSGDKLRVHLTSITGGTITYKAWIEY